MRFASGTFAHTSSAPDSIALIRVAVCFCVASLGIANNVVPEAFALAAGLLFLFARDERGIRELIPIATIESPSRIIHCQNLQGGELRETLPPANERVHRFANF